jgi:hypothetical protein
LFQSASPQVFALEIPFSSRSQKTALSAAPNRQDA